MKFLPEFSVVYCESVNECTCGFVSQPDDLQIAGVFQQHFQSDQAQDQAAGPGRVAPEMFPQLEPNGSAQKRNDKSDRADEQRTGPDVHIQYGKADAYCQSIDTGGNSQQEHALRTVAFNYFGIFAGFPDHVDADVQQQEERNPVVVRFDVFYGPIGCPVADDRHEELERAEPGAELDRSCKPGRGCQR